MQAIVFNSKIKCNKKLHLGCGTRNLPGWKHFDIRKLDEHIDYVGSADDLSQFEDNSIDEIYAYHLLEHFGRNDIGNVLTEWNIVLKKDGILRIAVPDFEAVAAEYSKNHELNKLMGLLYDRQDYKFNYHYVAFDFDTLKGHLEKCGFVNCERYDWRDFLPKGYGDGSRAYLPHMDFENGRMMSLNITARKYIFDDFV